ncbi:sulfurtransferase complex subunit TusC [Pantoea sp. Mhis]|uniref:sulfurtransferase complex subunit TusC n=1 Tax=Pantoea sp. Mhis TaxID=2576759 RepID=UPI001358067A|nr:sulfurtransferase complex subunit TusC [Pantoea sp. Mhis]MXP56539.1 sulfurtransferase complex subunit TusC [Pantoea sp. Mhis]
MKNTLAFLFTQVPHGNSSGREGLDAVLAASGVFNKNIGLFFIGDGILQLNCNQKPEKILARNYITTFAVLELCQINQIFICKESLQMRGQNMTDERILSAVILRSDNFYQKLKTYNHIIRF